MHKESCFVTLTYDDAHYHPSLNYRDFQLFMYKLRRRLGPTRFFMCGEYGDLNYRPHFHAILFGRSFKRDGVVSGSGECEAYRSSTLEDIWKNGYSSFGGVTYQSAAYVARYALKKITGERADAHYTRIDPFSGEVVKAVPEFAHMSLKPGIGYTWFQKYWKEVYLARDGVVLQGGRTVPSPRYYDQLLVDTCPDLKESKDFERYLKSQDFAADCTVDRLAVREQCAKAKLRFLRRDL